MRGSRLPSSRQSEKFPPRLRPIREEVWFGMFPVTEACASDGVAIDILLHFISADRVNLGRVESKNLGAALWRNLRIAVLVPELGRNLECTKCLYLILRRPIPD